jgi:hypothetical protein
LETSSCGSSHRCNAMACSSPDAHDTLDHVCDLCNNRGHSQRECILKWVHEMCGPSPSCVAAACLMRDHTTERHRCDVCATVGSNKSCRRCCRAVTYEKSLAPRPKSPPRSHEYDALEERLVASAIKKLSK